MAGGVKRKSLSALWWKACLIPPDVAQVAAFVLLSTQREIINAAAPPLPYAKLTGPAPGGATLEARETGSPRPWQEQLRGGVRVERRVRAVRLVFPWNAHCDWIWLIHCAGLELLGISARCTWWQVGFGALVNRWTVYLSTKLSRRTGGRC